MPKLKHNPAPTSDLRSSFVVEDRYREAVDFAILTVREQFGDQCGNEVREVLQAAERWLREHPARPN